MMSEFHKFETFQHSIPEQVHSFVHVKASYFF